jgi:predicted dehydrogenase
MVAHVVRFGDNYVYLKNIIDTNKYGKLIRLSMKRLSSIPTWGYENWFQDINRSGLECLDMSIHDIDFMQYCFGMPKDIVSVNYDLKGLNNYVGATYIYDGLSVYVEGGWYKAEMDFESGFTAIFENGYIKLAGGKLIDNGKEVSFENNTEAKDLGINIKLSNGYAREIQYFTDCLKAGKKPEMVTIDSSAASIALVKETLAKAVQI